MRRLREIALGAAAGLTAIGLLVGASIVSSPLEASAATSPTRYLGVFRETNPTAIASSFKRDFSITPGSVMWFDSWGSGRPFPVSEAKALWKLGILPHYTWEPWNTALGANGPGQIHLQDIL